MIAVVGCGAAKRSSRAPARLLYTGTLFRDHLRLAVAIRPRAIYVASALYGLIPAEEEIEPYERRLGELDEPSRAAWARGVGASVELVTDPGELVIVLAGKEYSTWREHASRRVWGPLDGLTLTERRAVVGRLCDRRRELF